MTSTVRDVPARSYWLEIIGGHCEELGRTGSRAARRGPHALITITIDDAQIEEIRALVAAGQAASVSGFVKHAIGIALFDAAGMEGDAG